MPASGYPNTVPLSGICHFDLRFSLELTISDNRKVSVKPTSINSPGLLSPTRQMAQGLPMSAGGRSTLCRLVIPVLKTRTGAPLLQQRPESLPMCIRNPTSRTETTKQRIANFDPSLAAAIPKPTNSRSPIEPAMRPSQIVSVLEPTTVLAPTTPACLTSGVTSPSRTCRR